MVDIANTPCLYTYIFCEEKQRNVFILCIKKQSRQRTLDIFNRKTAYFEDNYALKKALDLAELSQSHDFADPPGI